MPDTSSPAHFCADQPIHVVTGCLRARRVLPALRAAVDAERRR
ncbi:hypothetical protein [Halotalea alkalilenta]|nr:hypothetical protein [Halotalea alkalilenta]